MWSFSEAQLICLLLIYSISSWIHGFWRAPAVSDDMGSFVPNERVSTTMLRVSHTYAVALQCLIIGPHCILHSADMRLQQVCEAMHADPRLQLQGHASQYMSAQRIAFMQVP